MPRVKNNTLILLALTATWLYFRKESVYDHKNKLWSVEEVLVRRSFELSKHEA